MKRAMMVVVAAVMLGGCFADPTPYARDLWGDPCLTDKGPTTVSGCTHPSDGTGDPGWHSEVVAGICAPPTNETLAAMSSDLVKIGYTGACRPFCDATPTGEWSCPGAGVPTYEVHGLAGGWGFCYCADAETDMISPEQIAH